MCSSVINGAVQNNVMDVGFVLFLATKVSLGKKIKQAGRKGKGGSKKLCEGAKDRTKKAEKE